MKVFLSHSHEDKEVVEAIGNWLRQKGIDVWVDKWQLTAGDSLIQKIGEGIESADRLIVFLSPASVVSAWVRKEVANGLIMEIAKEKRLNEKFVIPALLKKCTVPFFLRDKLHANFADHPFGTACEELYNGILNKPKTEEASFDNRVITWYDLPPNDKAKYRLVLEFGVKLSPTEGARIEITFDRKYKAIEKDFRGEPKMADEWFFIPNNPTKPEHTGEVWTGSYEKAEPPVYIRKFATPSIKSTKSYYLYFEADEPLGIKDVGFWDFYGRQP